MPHNMRYVRYVRHDTHQLTKTKLVDMDDNE